MATDPAKPKRRVVKKAVSVREAAEKQASNAPKEMTNTRLFFHYVGVPFRIIWWPFKQLGRLKVVRFLGRILWPKYFRNSFKELKQVTWPNRRESFQLTSAVLVFAFIFGITIAVVDYGLDKLFKQVILK